MNRKLNKLIYALFVALVLSALAAQAAQANLAAFAASEYPANGAARSEGTVTSVSDMGTKMTCEEVGGEPALEGTGVLEAESSSLTGGEGALRNCHATILKIPVNVHQNGCEFEFTAGKLVSDTEGTTASSGNTATGSVNIVNCENPSQGLTTTVGAEGKTCHVDVPEGSPLSGSVHYETVTTEGGVEDVAASIINLKFAVNYTGGSACPGSTEEPVAGTTTFNGVGRVTAEGGISGTIM